MNADLFYVGTMAGLVVLSALASGSETALFSLRPSQVVRLREHGDTLGRMAVALLDDGRRLLLSILIANNAVNVCYFAIASLWARQHTRMGAGAITLGSLGALILFGEILPKIIANGLPEVFARLVAPPLRLLVLALRPACLLVERFFGRLPDDPGEGSLVTGEEIKHVIEQSRRHGVVSQQVHDRLQEVVDLATVPVRRVMTHRVDCPAIAADADHATAVAALRDKPGPYVLVYDERDDCVGILLAQDLLRGGRPSKRMRRPAFVPAGAMLAAVIGRFRDLPEGVLVVVDEYGATLGMLTLAHLGNELLGDGSSEDLPEPGRVEQVDDAHWRLPGDLALEAWYPLFEDREPLLGCTTIGGFITRQLGAIPEPGDTVLVDNLLFRVEEVEGHRIRTLSVERLDAATARRVTRQMAGGLG